MGNFLPLGAFRQGSIPERHGEKQGGKARLVKQFKKWNRG